MDGNKKKVVHITQSLSRGGAERLITELGALSSRRYNVTVICQYNSIDAEFEQKLKGAGARLIMMSKKKGFSLSAIIELYKLLSKIKPDIIHTHIQSSAYAFLYYLFHSKVKKVHTIHTLPQTEFTKFHMFVQWLEYKFLNVVPVAVSDTVKLHTQRVYRLSGGRVKCVYNGINTEFFKPMHNNLKSDFTLINVANFSVWKRQCDIVKAMAKTDGNIKCIFAGDGGTKDKTQKLANRLGVYDRCLFLGRINSEEEVKNYLNKANAFILTSEFEGTPISIIEAYACGLPVIVTDVGGIRDLTDDGINGYLCKKGDIDDIAHKIMLLKNDPSLCKKMTYNNLQKSKKFDIRKTCEEYFKIYEER